MNLITHFLIVVTSYSETNIFKSQKCYLSTIATSKDVLALASAKKASLFTKTVNGEKFEVCLFVS